MIDRRRVTPDTVIPDPPPRKIKRRAFSLCLVGRHYACPAVDGDDWSTDKTGVVLVCACDCHGKGQP